MTSQFLQIMVTIDDRMQAEKLLKILLQDCLIACGQCLPQMTSYYRWQDEIRADNEYLLLLKTQKHHYQAVERQIKKHHPYDEPEIIAVDIVAGSEDYLTWIKNETSRN
ncbi:MAG: divalent-cation tolerance protein CutA [Proteobacteria bacterium]|nr:MAG: divalent-cation tolerance protein CutA [Pseudomonadota bacterium]